MRTGSHRRILPSWWTLAARMALGLLVTCASFAQAGSSDRTPPQEKSNAPEKKDKKPSAPQTARLQIEVTDNQNKPVGNATVYVRFYEPRGVFHHENLVELDFKTNQDGSVKVPEIPRGKILVQVIAKGWHTFGKWYDLVEDEQTIQVKLAPPTHWY
jgi:hypothetical protein